MPDQPAGLGEQANRLMGAVGKLNASIEKSNEQIADLTRSNRHNKKMIRVVAASVVFDILLSLGLGYAITKAHQASDQNMQTIHQTCLSTNDARAANVHLWETLVDANPAPTPEAKTRADNILAIVRQTFAPRDCG